MPSLIKRPAFWISLILVAGLALGGAFWRGWLPLGQQTAVPAANAPSPTQEPPPLDVPSAITVILVCSYAIDRVLKGLLFLLALRPAWSAYYPDPASLPSPGSFKDEVAAAQASKNRKQAEVRQKFVYFVPAFFLGVALATFGHVRVLHVLGFPDKETTEVLADILLTALILMGGADQTSQVLRMLGARTALKAEPSQPRPIEVYGKLILEEPADQRRPAHDQAAKAAAASQTG